MRPGRARRAHAGYRGPGASAASKPRPVSTRKSACAAFRRPASACARMACELLLRHAGPGQDARALHPGGAVTTTTASQRRSPPVSNSSGMSSTATGARGGRAPARNASSLGAHQRMHDRLELASGAAGSPSTRAPKRRAVDDPVRDGAGKRRLDQRGRRRRDRGDAPPRRHRAPERRARRNIAAVADLPMPIEPVRPRTKVIAVPSISATISGAQRGVTSGVTPNQRSKPGTAWCSSMPRPSTVAMPAGARRPRSGVSSGT